MVIGEFRYIEDWKDKQVRIHLNISLSSGSCWNKDDNPLFIMVGDLKVIVEDYKSDGDIVTKSEINLENLLFIVDKVVD